MTRILYITDQIYLHGGAEKILIQKLNYWADVLGAEVLLLTTQQLGKKPFFPLSGKVRHVDLAIPGGSLATYLNPKNALRFASDYQKVKNAIGAFNPDAVFLISLGFVRYVLPWAAKGYPIFNEYHTSYYGFRLGYEKAPLLVKIKKRLSFPLKRWVENRYTGIVFLNQTEYDHYKRRNGLIIPNFFDPSAEHPSVPKKKIAISLGRLSDQKGYDLLLESWAQIASEFPDWTLDIYGQGENRAALEAQVMRLGLTSAHINQPTDQVPEKLAESAFYVMSSRFETFPMVLLEALSAGIPVVSFDCPSGPRSMLIENDDSLMASAQNTAELAQKMRIMMSDEQLRLQMGEKGRRNVNRFNPEVVMNQWVELVEKHKNQLANR